MKCERQPLPLKKAMQALRKYHPEITLTSLPARQIVTDGVNLYLRGNGAALERIDDGQMAFSFVVELAHLQSEVTAALRKAA